MTGFQWWLLSWVSGFVMMTTAWWWHNDVRLLDVVRFLIGSAAFGPLYVCLYWFLSWLDLREPRRPIILIRRRGR